MSTLQPFILTMTNLAGNDITSTAIEWVTQFPDVRTLVIELPCLGIARLVYRSGLPASSFYQCNIDRWLLAWAHRPGETIAPYVYQHGNIDYLLIDPLAYSDHPVTRQISSTVALTVLLQLKKQLQDYDYVLLVTQGTCIHPMTYAAMQVADTILLCSTDPIDQIINEKSQQRLITNYGIDATQIVAHSLDQPNINSVFESIQKRRATHHSFVVPNLIVNVPGLIDPTEFEQSGCSGEIKITSSLVVPSGVYDFEDGQLSFELEESEAYPPSIVPVYSVTYMQVKQLLCSEGIQSANQLCKKLCVRKQTILSIFIQLRVEGMIEKKSNGQGYQMIWSEQQIAAYLNHTPPVLIPVPSYS